MTENLATLRQELDEVRAQAEADRICTASLIGKLRAAYTALEVLERLYTNRKQKGSQ
jgi:hypothetical protein